MVKSIIQCSDYGDGVNYSANGVDDLEIFLNDGTNVYLIASDYVPNSRLNKPDNIENGDGKYRTNYEVSKGNLRIDNDLLYMSHISSWNSCDGYWLTSCSARNVDYVMYVYCSGKVVCYEDYRGAYLSVRPLCLPAINGTDELEWSQWNLEN